MITASKCLYIKLGQGGEFEADCIRDGLVILDYRSIDHVACVSGEWDKVLEQCRKSSKSEGAAKNHLNQIKLFYESSEDTLWFTFYAGKLYWTFAEKKVFRNANGTKSRKCKGQWSCESLNGSELAISVLSGKLTRTKGYRQTICESKVSEYLLRRINGQFLPTIEKAKASLDILENALEQIIKDLTPQDFELLVESVFSNTGWVRLGVAGGTEKDIDLELMSPVTNEKVAVQIKSNTNQAQLEEYIARLEAWEADKFFFVFHSSDRPLKIDPEDSNVVHLIDSKTLSQMIVSSGLTKWLIDKAS